MKYGLALLLLLVTVPLMAYEPNSTSPYTFNGTYSCTPCEIFSHDKVGDGFFHDSGCTQSGFPLYFCSCSIGYTNGQFLAQPILRVIDDTTVELEYFAKNAYCNPPDSFTPNEPNAIPNRISIVAINPQTMSTIGTVHTVPPYWEHGKIQMTDMNPRCTMYRAVYQVMDTSFNTYAVSSDIVGGTGSSSCAPIPDIGSCSNCSGSGGPAPQGGVSPGAGQPVNVGSGNVYTSQPLFSVQAPGGSLDFSITYNSLETNAGALGPGFTHPFAQSMLATNNTNLRVWRRPDGTRVIFARENHPGIGESWRPIYPGDATGSVVLDSSAGRYKWTDLSGTVTEVDSSSGLWRKTTDRWGNTLTASYTGTNLTTLTDTLGRTWTFGYSGSLLTSITDGDSNQWRFAYDGSNRLEKIFDPLHTSTTPWRQFAWTTYATGKSAVATIADDSGAVLEGHEYDSSGRATSSWSGPTVGGSAPSPGTGARDLVTLSYDSTTQTTVTTTVDSSVTQATVYTLAVGSGRFLASSIAGSCGSCGASEDAQTFTFDEQNHVLTKTVGLDRTGSGGTDERVTSSYTYNANGMVLTATEAAGKTEEKTTTYAYGQSSWPSFVTSVTESSVAKSGQSKITSSAWNSGETQLTVTKSGYLRSTDSSATSYVTTTLFDAKHRVTEIDGPRTNQKTTFTYHSDSDTDLNRRGRLATTNRYSTTTDALTTAYDDYDVYGNAATQTDPNDVDTAYTFDARGRVLTLTSVQPPSDSNEPPDYVTTHVYDSRDRLTSTTYPRGNGLRFTYEDGTNRRLSIIRVDDTGDEHERMLYTLNTIGRPTSEAAQECPSPADPCTSWTTKRSDAFAYDTAGRLSTVTHPDSSFRTYAYDSRGNTTGVRDERHSAANTLHAYDFRNRLTSITQKRTLISGSDVVTSYTYDAQNNIASITDPKSSTTTYAHDDFGRVQTMTSPVSGTTSTTYDAANNATSTTDANGATTTRTFDLLNRVLTESSSRTGLPTEDVEWTYDDPAAGQYGMGRIASMSDPYLTSYFTYERRGLMTNGFGGYSTYDENGNRSRLGMSHYTFDFADRPLSADWETSTFAGNAKYLPFGPLKELTFGNGAVKTMTFDSRYRPTENKLTLSSTTIAEYDYDHDDAGNVTEIHDAVNSAYNRDFAYDDLNRLIAANTGTSLWGTGSYAYDTSGNMTSLSLGTWRNLTFSYSGTTSKLSTVNSTSVSYDSAGNEDSAISARNLLSFNEGHMVYDGRGVRAHEYLGLFETSTPWHKYWTYSPDLKLLASSHTMVSLTSFTMIAWFGDLPVGQVTKGFWDPYIAEGDLSIFRYTFTDHLGTPILQMVGNDVVWQAEYDPYGGLYDTRVATVEGSPLGFPGQEFAYDSDGTGRTYNIFRWYRSSWGRYTQTDPIPLRAGVVPYLYAADNPLSNVDPFGLWSLSKSCKGYEAAISQAMAKAVSGIAKCGLSCSEGQKILDQMMDFEIRCDTSTPPSQCGQKDNFGDGVVLKTGVLTGQCGCMQAVLAHEATHGALQSPFDSSEGIPETIENKCFNCGNGFYDGKPKPKPVLSAPPKKPYSPPSWSSYQ